MRDTERLLHSINSLLSKISQERCPYKAFSPRLSTFSRECHKLKKKSPVLLPLTRQDLDRGPGEVEILPQLVDQKALVGEVHQFWIVAENNESRRIGLDLGHVVDPEPLALDHRRRHQATGFQEQVV